MCDLKRRSKCEWSIDEIAKARQKAKTALDNLAFQKDHKLRLKECLAEVSRSADRLDSPSLLMRYTFVMSALVHHEKHGGLSDSQSVHLSKLAFNILLVSGISYSSTDRLAFLYGDIHRIQSLIARKSGNHSLATTEHILACHYSKADSINGAGQELLGHAIRAFRMGHLETASTSYILALQSRLTSHQRLVCQIGLLKALRLSQKNLKFKVLAEEVQQSKNFEPITNEIRWEVIIQNFSQTGKFEDIVQFLKDSSADYIAEAYLFACSTKTRNNRIYFESKRSFYFLENLKSKRIKKRSPLETVTLSIHELYDTEIPFSLRLKSAADIFQILRNLPSIESELLVLAALGRWLSRNRQIQFSNLVGFEYKSLCQKITQNTTDDIYNFF